MREKAGNSEPSLCDKRAIVSNCQLFERQGSSPRATPRVTLFDTEKDAQDDFASSQFSHLHALNVSKFRCLLCKLLHLLVMLLLLRLFGILHLRFVTFYLALR